MPEYLCQYAELQPTSKGKPVEVTCSVDICPFEYMDPAAFDKHCCMSKYQSAFKLPEKVVKK